MLFQTVSGAGTQPRRRLLPQFLQKIGLALFEVSPAKAI